MMIPAVVLVLALAASGFSLPVTPEVHVSTENVPQYFTEVPHIVEKTGVVGSPETYSSVGQQQQVQSINTPVQKAENAPASVNQPQAPYHHPEHPVLLPIQPLSVVGQAGQVFRPVIVPAEAITAGRVIIAGIETIQQRSFPQNEFVNVENPVPYQQGVNPAIYTPVQVEGAQLYYVQPDEKQTPVVPTEQQYTPNPVQYNTEPLIREQIVPVNPVPENVEQVQNYNPVPIEPNVQYNPQVYSLPQNVQPVVVQSPEKSGTYQVGTGYVPVQTVQQPVQQQTVQEVVEKQGSVYTPVQSHEVEPQTYTGTPIVTEKQGEHQQQTYVPVQNQPTYNVQSTVEKQGQYQAHTADVQQQQVQTTQQEVESQVPVQRVEPVQHEQVYTANPAEQFQPVQAHPVESVYHQQQVYNANPVDQIQPEQAHPVEPINQQVYSAQPVVDQVQSQVPYQQVVQQQAADYVQQVKISEVEHQQPYVQPQEVVTETGYDFGDKVQQHTSVNVLSGVPQTQVSSVQPSVASP